MRILTNLAPMKTDTMKTPKTVPLARLRELASLPHADRIAVRPQRGTLNFDYTVKVYPSRESLETFLKNPGAWKAIVKNPVHPNMLVYPAFETPTI